MTPTAIVLGTLTVPGRPENVSEARAFVAELARRKGMGGPDLGGSRPGDPDLGGAGLGAPDPGGSGPSDPDLGGPDLGGSGPSGSGPSGAGPGAPDPGGPGLDGSGLGGSKLSETAALLTSELVTNAVLHSASGQPGGSVTIVVIDAPQGLQVEVIDDGSPDGGPEVRGDRYAAEGHGLFLVEHLAADWGYLRAPVGTTVWFRIEAETASASSAGDGSRGKVSHAGTGMEQGPANHEGPARRNPADPADPSGLRPGWPTPYLV